MATWLVIAAERRELDGILKRSGEGQKLDWPAEFADEVQWKGDRWLLIANGPGTGLVEEALTQKRDVSGIVSTGFCGALDPALRVGDIVIDGEFTLPREAGPLSRVSKILSLDRVAVTSREKLALRQKTGTAAEDMPLDFNLYRDTQGRFSRSRIARAALARPFAAIPALLRLNRHCQMAAESLGDFFADCRL